ncbi:amino acid adenylation domain-containing protein [Lysobacter cavernae]|uniref:Amino acid adenylation domain-containing protein n=1 Tax=Lysobacter cavernae TaxID=1685901 RepID=A0ABV7RJN8_9GAMM
MSQTAPVAEASIAVDYDPFAGGELSRVVPTTEPQREVWLADRLGPDASLAFNESVSLRLRGPLDSAALQAALKAVVDRHDALRANFGPDGETLCVHERIELAMPLRDLAALPEPQRTEALDQRLHEAVDTPFALDRDVLLRAELLRLGTDEHVLLLTAHHIVCDGWSWWVLVRELGNFYAQHGGHAEVVAPEAEAFADYALAEATRAGGDGADEAYWLSRFVDGAPVLDLPTDRPRPLRRSFASAREDCCLDTELVAAIRRLGARRGASLFATLLAGFATLLSRLCAQSQVVIGIPAAGQSVDGHDHLVGHCVNLLPLRFDLDPAQPFAQALDAAQDILLDALEHQRYTFGTLLKKLRIERDPARLPLISVMFNIDQALDHESTGFPGLALDFSCNPRSHENFELFVNAVQAHGELRLECQYNRDLFDAATVRRWLAAFESLLRAAVVQPEARVAALPLVDADACAELAALQPPPVAYDRDGRMHESFEAQCDQTPQRTALHCGDAHLSYAELDARANRIAHLLRARGVRRGALVGLALDRNADMLAALLGVLKCGAGYVPLDPQFPAERLAYMAGDAGLAALLTQQRHAAHFDLRGRPVLMLDRLDDELATQPTSRLGRDEDAATPESVAYVIYTSGSTGRPKGVQVPHRAVNNFLVGMRREPGIGADDRLLAVTTLSFDIAVLELLLPLSVGAAVVLADRDSASDGGALKALLAASGATIMQATPATWRLLLEAGWTGDSGFTALCGGEALPPDLAAQLLPRCAALWNLYGPTETTVWSTCARIAAAPGGPIDVHIGRPIANTQVWILDAQGEPCPRGVPGEICIGGDGVTLGYLDRPELTADRFIPDRFAGAERSTVGRAAMLYRTGDRGRWRADGNLEHLGRLDFQVKVRGYRIELGEIENHLASHPRVARVVAMAREDRPGDVRLAAYVVAQPGAAIDEAALQAHLRQALPDYMIPQHIVALDAMPLLPNGKIDRKALPVPTHRPEGVETARTEPRNALERTIAAAMAQVLGVPEVGIDDDFFAFGGHSLLAAQLTSRLNRELGASLSLRALFDGPTVARLAKQVATQKTTPAGAARTSVARRADQRRAPLSLMQQRLWVLEQMEPGRVTYNTPSAHRLRGPMDLAAFERAFQELLRRQAALRTIIVPEGDGAVQVVCDRVDASLLPVEDLSALPVSERETALQQRLEALTAAPFQLDQAPLFRARLFRLGEQEHALFFMTHHIIWDGWSFDLFYSEMASLYEAFVAGRPSPLPELEVSYGDFSEWHLQWLRGDELESQIAHWKQHLAGDLEPLQLPHDHPRPVHTTGGGSTEWVHVDRSLAEAMHEVGAGAEATLFMTLLAAYYALLHRLSGQRDLIVGLPVRNRSSEALETVMGFFVNMLPLRLRIDPEQPFIELVRAVRAAVVDAFAYPDVPFEHLVRKLNVPRDTSRSPIYQALFSFQDVRQRKTRWGELQHEHLLLFQRGTSNDVGLWFLEHGDGLSGGLTYNTDILSADTATRLHQRFIALLESVRRDPGTAVGDLDLFCDDDRRLLADANATAAAQPVERTVHALLDAQAERTPARTAIRFDDTTTSYAQLQARSRRIAAGLHARGVRAGDLVGICLDRGPDLVASMLAVLRLGAAYVPLDPAYPAERLRFMADDARLALVVSRGAQVDALAWPREKLMLLDADAQSIEAQPLVDDVPVAADAVAYVIYTSGSTGKPKGVQVPHRAVLNFLASMRQRPGLAADDRLLAITTTSFDIAVLELFLPLSLGAEVVMARRETAADGHALAALLDASAATVMQATPSTWRMLIDTGWAPRAGFKALCGGEALAADLAVQLHARCAEVWNLYGPTETTVWSTCWRVDDPGHGIIAIGTPIANTVVRILDERLRPCPIGVPGEICIGGEGVAVGYLHRPELTAERFIVDRHAAPSADGASPPRLYRTGDLGRWRADGQLEHLGRLDFQLKLRGHRIELGEVEHALLSHPQVARAVAVAREDRPGDVRLVAYVVAAPQRALAEAALIAHLRNTLPDYMIPQHLVVLDALPLLPNGKIDRKSLPHPRPSLATAPATVADAAPPDPRVDYLAGVWAGLLGGEVTPTDNFFDLGGHSMLAVQMANRVARDTGVRIKLIRLATQTLAQIAVDLPQHGAVAPQQPLGARIARGFIRLFQSNKARY